MDSGKKFLSFSFLFTCGCLSFSQQFTISDETFTNPAVYIVFVLAALFCFCVYWISKESRRRLREVISQDDLTGLLTQKRFKAEVRKILRTAKPGEYTMLSLDIVKYRYITETFSQQVGNSVLIELAKHLEEVAPPGSLICRNYTDNFSILVPIAIFPVLEDYILLFTNIKTQTTNLLPEHYQLEFSSGAYVIENTSEDVILIIEKADTARELGKNGLNPNRLALYTDQMQNDAEHEKDITLDMNRAFENQEFVVYYQPKFRFDNGKIMGAEALIRWNHHTKGMLPPGDFVPLFERNGFIQKIDIFVFENVCRFLDRWNKSGPNGTCPMPIVISCNLSRVQLYNPDVANMYAEIAGKYQIAPCQVEIELTESLMMDNKERLLKAMNDIKNAGFTISVDDFGSGFSSLSLLKDIPANVIKLDKEFLNTEGENKKEKVIINSVINMAKELDLTTVAEGVEDQSQSDLLKSMGCDIVQGFFYARPMPEEQYESLLRNAVN
ncbi:MAG: GGDEF domain-containing protein [Treponema sp.]|nr:GGDEF domain-containing protein [Treponema sp.]